MPVNDIFKHDSDSEEDDAPHVHAMADGRQIAYNLPSVRILISMTRRQPYHQQL